MTDKPADRFYVYTLIDPRTDDVFYVGKGTGNRRHAHLAEFRATRVINAVKFARIGEIVAAGLVPVAEIVAVGLTEAEAFAAERDLIRKIGWDNLTNIKAGTMTAKDRAVVWAKALLAEVKPFAEWARERRPSLADVALYIRMVEELRAIADGLREFRIVGPDFEVSC